MLGRLQGSMHACVLLHEVETISPVNADLHVCPTGNCCSRVCCHLSISLALDIKHLGLWHHRKATQQPRRSTMGDVKYASECFEA